MNDKIKEICNQASEGKLSADVFYDKLRSIADDTRTDDDTACIIEDCLMEMEMAHDGSGSKKSVQKLVKETAARLINELS